MPSAGKSQTVFCMSNKLQQQVPALQITCSCCEYGGIAILLHIDYYISDYCDGYIADYYIDDFHIADHYIVTIGHIDYYISDYCDGIYS